MKLLLLSILILSCGHGFAQKQVPLVLRFEHLSDRDGLSNNNIRCIYKDRGGFMWFGTFDGLNRYDGTSFKIYRHDAADSNSIKGNNILNLSDDRHGGIWVSSLCHGFTDFNIYSGKGTTLKEERGRAGLLQTSCDVSIAYDDAGNSWIRSSEFFSKYDPVKKAVTQIYQIPQKEGSIFYSMVADKNMIWLAQNSKLKSYDTRTGVLADHSSFFEKAGACVISFITPGGDLFVCTFNRGLYIINPKTGRVNHLFDSLNINQATVITLNGRKQLWLATVSGLFTADWPGDVYSLTKQSFTRYSPDPKDPYSLSSNVISSIFEDENGMIWVGTEDGINKLNPAYLRFEKKEFNASGLPGFEARYDPVNLFIQQDAGKKMHYWFSYWHGGGLVKTDENFNVLKQLKFKHWNRPPPANSHVSNVFYGSNGNLWITTWDGLWEYDPNKDKLLRNYKLNDHDTTAPRVSAFDFGTVDAEGNIWIGTCNQYLHKLDPVTGKWTAYTDGPADNQTKYNRCDLLFSDSRNRMWSSDVSFYDLKTRRFYKPAFDGVSAGITEDKQQHIWLATESGIAKYNEAGNNFTLYGVKEGLTGADVQSIATDEDDNIWAGTLNGLSVLNGKTNSIRTFTTSDGLPVNQMGSLLKILPDGKMLLSYSAGEKKGYITFSPRELLSEKKSGPFHFTSFNVAGRELSFDRSPDSLSELHLDYKDNLLSIGFNAPAFADNINIRYRYRLGDSSGKWTELGKQNNISFTGLAGGTYLLTVEATDGNGDWMKKNLHLKIIVHPPFWRTWWFICLVVLFTGLVITYFVWRRIRHIKATAAVKQQITGLETKALKAQMNPHFVFNSLTSIQDSIVHGKTEAASKYLGKFSRLIRAILENSDKKYITLEQEIDYLRLYLELESFRFDDLSFEINVKDIPDPSFIKIPAMLIQPFVENAVKHGLGHKEGSKKVTVSFAAHGEDMLEVKVEDDGIGREQAAIINRTRSSSHQSMGMKITAERLRLQHEQGKPGISITDCRDDNGKASGTCVIIYISTEK